MHVLVALLVVVSLANLAVYVNTGNVGNLIIAIAVPAGCLVSYWLGRRSRRQATRGRSR